MYETGGGVGETIADDAAAISLEKCSTFCLTPVRKVSAEVRRLSSERTAAVVVVLPCRTANNYCNYSSTIASPGAKINISMITLLNP